MFSELRHEARGCRVVCFEVLQPLGLARSSQAGLQAEIAMVRPAALGCLGTTAGKALPGSQVRVGRDRAEPMESELTELVTLTAHPSSILRS